MHYIISLLTPEVTTKPYNGCPLGLQGKKLVSLKISTERNYILSTDSKTVFR